MPVKTEVEHPNQLHFVVQKGEVQVTGVLTSVGESNWLLSLSTPWRGVRIEAPQDQIMPTGQKQSVAQAYRLIEQVRCILQDDSPAVEMCREELITKLFMRAGLLTPRGA